MHENSTSLRALAAEVCTEAKDVPRTAESARKRGQHSLIPDLPDEIAANLASGQSGRAEPGLLLKPRSAHLGKHRGGGQKACGLPLAIAAACRYSM